MKRSTRGSLALVMLSLTLTVLLLFLSVSAGIQHYQQSRSLEQRARARDMAESTLHLAMSQLCRNPGWGTGRTLADTLQLPGAGVSDGEGFLSFHQGSAHDKHILFSTNNLNSEASGGGDGGLVVPRKASHLVALGKCGSQQIQIETVFVQPPYPTGCAAQGPVLLRAVRIWGQPPGSSPQEPPNPSPWKPANVFTNAAGARALRLDRNCDIFGNASAVGRVDLETGATVRGEAQSGSQRRTIPRIDVQAYWNQVRAYRGIIPFVPGETLTSFCVVDSSLNVGGDLAMNGGLLAVNGDLTVGGKISGRGFIVVTGKVDAGAGATLTADHRLALICGGDLKLRGTGQAYHFSGLLYSQGQVEANDLTVLGALVCDGRNGTETVTLDRVNIVQDRIGVNGSVGFPLIFGTRGSQGDEPLALQLQAYRDERSPAREWLFMGEGMIADNRMTGQWPPPGGDRVFRLVLSPPTATWYETRGFDANKRPNPPTSTVQYPYNGTEAALKVLLKRLVDTQTNGQWANSQARIYSYIDQLKALANTPTSFAVDLNNLLPEVESSRLPMWRESAPSQ